MAILLRPLTAIEYAATAFERWQSQYADWRAEDKTSDGVTKEERRQMFNTMERSPANVARILNTGWSHPQCSACGERFEVVAEFKEEWSSESWTICLACARRIDDLLKQFPGALGAVK